MQNSYSEFILGLKTLPVDRFLNFSQVQFRANTNEDIEKEFFFLPYNRKQFSVEMSYQTSDFTHELF